MVSVELKNITKKYGGTTAVDDVSLEIGRGELFFLLGPSGCGKTTILRMVAGFVTPDSGEVLFDARDVSKIPPHGRNVGMVFQTYALFPHMTVEQNIGYGLRFRKIESSEKKKRVVELLDRTRLTGLGGRLPSQLSGGQQQRVALARALVIQPDVLLLDEPLSNLDTRLRVEMREEIRRIHNEFGVTALYVTHDQEEALSLAHRVAIMRDGVIVQSGAPSDIYMRPRNEFVARFVGDSNILPAKAARRDGRPGLETPAGWLPSSSGPPRNGTVFVSVRPENVSLCQPIPGAANAKISSVTFLGSAIKAELALEDGTAITALFPGTANGVLWKSGDIVGVRLEVDDAVVLE